MYRAYDFINQLCALETRAMRYCTDGISVIGGFYPSDKVSMHEHRKHSFFFQGQLGLPQPTHLPFDRGTNGTSYTTGIHPPAIRLVVAAHFVIVSTRGAVTLIRCSSRHVFSP